MSTTSINNPNNPTIEEARATAFDLFTSTGRICYYMIYRGLSDLLSCLNKSEVVEESASTLSVDYDTSDLTI